MVRARSWLCGLAASAFWAGCATPQNQVIRLADSFEPLRQQFNSDKHRVRVLALFSPT